MSIVALSKMSVSDIDSRGFDVLFPSGVASHSSSAAASDPVGWLLSSDRGALDAALQLTPHWLSKLHTALRLGLHAAAGVLISILRATALMVQSSDDLERVVDSLRAGVPDALALVCATVIDMVDAGVVRRGFTPRCAEFWMEWVQAMCSTSLKEGKGQWLGQERMQALLFELLSIPWGHGDSDAASGHHAPFALSPGIARSSQSSNSDEVVYLFTLQRAAAASIINLYRGNKDNKDIGLSRYVWTLQDTLLSAVDYYLQLQCVEILFRLFHYNPAAVLKPQSAVSTSTSAKDRKAAAVQKRNPSLDDRITAGLQRVKNDAHNLLKGLEDILADINRAASREDDVFGVDAARLDTSTDSGGSRVISGPTVLYFNRVFLLFMVSDTPGVAVTIPHRDVRSMRLSKDRKISLRLSVIPAPLQQEFGMATGQETSDILHVHLTDSSLKLLRTKPVQFWIESAKQRLQALCAAGGESVTNAEQRSVPRGPSRGKSIEGAKPPALSCASPQSSSSKRSRSAAPAASSGDQQAPRQRIASTRSVVPPGPDFVDRVEEEVRAAMEKRIHERQAAKEDILAAATHEMQRRIFSYREGNAQDRDALEDACRQDAAHCRALLSKVKEDAAASVERLNRGLEDINRVMEVVSGHLNRLQEMTVSVPDAARHFEVAQVEALKLFVDSELVDMQKELVAYIQSNDSVLEELLSKDSR